MAASDSLPATDELDNMGWHALRGPLREFASVGPAGRALRMDKDVGYFCGLPGFEAEDWADMAALIAGKGVATFFQPDVPDPPDGWAEVMHGVTAQMVAGEMIDVPAVSTVVLGERDVADMLALTRSTEPGPFLERTHQLGETIDVPYIGVRDGGELIAMAGVRLATDNWVEISAVCTAPQARGRGLAAALTAALVAAIRSGGREAMLHVAENNTAAISVYERLGFFTRRMTGFRAFRPPS